MWEGLPVSGVSVIATAAAAFAIAPFAALAAAPGVAQAAPCAGAGSNPVSCQNCLVYVEAYHTSNVCYNPAPPRPPPPSPSVVSVPTLEPLPELPPVHTPLVVPSPSPPPPTTVAVQTPKLTPSHGAPGNAALVAPPKGLDASPQAIADAKAAPVTRINPANPLEPPSRVYDFRQQVQNVVDAHRGNVDLIKADNQELVRPKHWDYVDYDDNHRPVLYNPLGEAMTFRYFYDGAYREAFVPAGGRIVLDAATVGLVPFTAVGYSHVASGSFYGGASIPPAGSDGPPPPTYTPPTPPDVYEHVSALVAADNKTVEVGQVEVVGHDASQPAGSQDTFLLNDSTLAWGQVDDASSATQIRVTRTQSLPGAGPTDNGDFLVALTALKEPAPPSAPWWPSALAYAGLTIGAGLIAWTISRPKRRADLAPGD
ncbi:hypothetical protein A5673_11615 [Mycobacterium sp. E3198]|nr:hypothetical protein A5673_11615 [Mycobacterium sp. E3198]